MSRLRIAAEHLLALPLALVLFVGGGIVAALLLPTGLWGGAIDIQRHDTYYVVAHFHVVWLVAATVLAAAVVARRHGRLNWALWCAVVLLVINLAAAAGLRSVPQAPGDAVLRRIAGDSLLNPGLLEVFIGSALVAIVLALCGLALSLAAALQSKP